MPSINKIRKKRLDILMEFEGEGDFKLEAIKLCEAKFNTFIGDLGEYKERDKTLIIDTIKDFNEQLQLILKTKGVSYGQEEGLKF